MDDKFKQLDIENFSQGHQSFFESFVEILKTAESQDALHHILPLAINQQYLYSDEKRRGGTRLSFLKSTYLVEDTSKLIPFINALIPQVLTFAEMSEYQLALYNKNLSNTVIQFTNLLLATTDSSVFNLEYYYSKYHKEIRRKLDEATTETINSNLDDLEEGNRKRYEEAIADFLSYDKALSGSNNHFYNDSLNKLKKVVENTLENNYKKEDGGFPKLSNKKQISNILFDSTNHDFEHMIEYVIKNIHHESGGQPKKFTEKEYMYLWLELNKILYLLNRYQK